MSSRKQSKKPSMEVGVVAPEVGAAAPSDAAASDIRETVEAGLAETATALQGIAARRQKLRDESTRLERELADVDRAEVYWRGRADALRALIRPAGLQQAKSSETEHASAPTTQTAAQSAPAN